MNTCHELTSKHSKHLLKHTVNNYRVNIKYVIISCSGWSLLSYSIDIVLYPYAIVSDIELRLFKLKPSVFSSESVSIKCTTKI